MSINFGKTKTSKGVTADSRKATSSAGIASAKSRNQTVSKEGSKTVIRQTPGTFGGQFSADRQPGKIIATAEGQRVVKDESPDVAKYFKKPTEDKTDILTMLPIGGFPAGSGPQQALVAGTREEILQGAIADIQKGAPITDLQIQAIALGTNSSFNEAKNILKATFPDRAFSSGDNAVIIEQDAIPNQFQSFSRASEFVDNRSSPVVFSPDVPTQISTIPSPAIISDSSLPDTSVKEALFAEDILPLLSPIKADGTINWPALAIYIGVALIILGGMLT